MTGKAHKHYGSALYARIVVFLREHRTPYTVKQVCTTMVGTEYTRADAARVINILNNLHAAGMVTRELEPGDKKHITRYIYKYKPEAHE
jgi:predicted transcriptional regulator